MELGRDDRRTGLSVTDDLTKATLTVAWVIILNKPFFLAILGRITLLFTKCKMPDVL